jgi:hypothetical protein
MYLEYSGVARPCNTFYLGRFTYMFGLRVAGLRVAGLRVAVCRKENV